ncbi:MAG: hypothetical protein HOO96_03205 [Polyangiaceae bacterium]|nr:hypothetical protein [Polyangiaceae bacterium]
MERELIAGLHAAARRYCIDAHAERARRYAALDQGGGGYDATSGRYSRSARDLFPRYQQLRAMQLAVERFVAEDFTSLADARRRLSDAIEAAQIDNVAVRADPVCSRAAEEESAALLRHLAALDEDLLWRTAPLPFCRVLSPQETDGRRETLSARYGVWYGGVVDALPKHAGVPSHLTFVLSRLPDPTGPLQALVAPMAARITELNELTESFELEVVLATFTHSEGFWFPADLGWMVYASHEDTLTVAGEPLVSAVRAHHAGWLAHLAR